MPSLLPACLLFFVLTPDVEGSSLRRSPVVKVVEQAGPAVVNIAASSRSTPFARGWLEGGPWDKFFGRQRRVPRGVQSRGSGVIIEKNGLVLTNEHVIAGASDVTVTLADRRTFSAEVIGSDSSFDIAVLQIADARNLPVVPQGTSQDLMIGESAVAIGNPFGLANTVTTGVVSALHRVIEVEDRVYEDFIQTDAAINPGNSGGALLNIEGKLVGINTAIYSSGTGIGFAIPIDKALAVVREVIRFGEVRPAYTGLLVDPHGTNGAQIVAVLARSPAAEAGLYAGDVIVDFGGQEVKDGRAFRQLARVLVPGRTRKITVRRDGQRTNFMLRVRELDINEVSKIAERRLGLGTRVRRGRVIIHRVVRGSDADQVGIRTGDILVGLAGRRVRRDGDLRPLLATIYDADEVSVIIGRDGRAYSVTLGLGLP
ncbi:MAG: trypsin-like peptidase domain-containing protein [Myxococcales bacterium]|nr:trypsin-like peptidase domain-containing protein [Myxococcales bacterium]